MLIYRALNDADLDINVVENGLYSKANVSEALQIVMNTDISASNKIITDKEYNDSYKLYREENPTLGGYNIIGIMQRAIDKQNRLNKIKEVLFNNYTDSSIREEYKEKLLDILSSKNAHILNGSNADYDWISFTKDLNTFFKYYLAQKKRHAGVCMNSNINNYLFDDDMLAADMSSIEVIENSGIVCNKQDQNGIYKETNVNSRLIRYALADNEVLYYNYIPKERLFFLEPLQVDMLYNGMINYKYFNTNGVLRNYLYESLTDKLWEELETSPRMYKFIYNSLYEKRLTVAEMSREFGISIEGILDIKREILELLDEIDGEKYFKNKCEGKVRIMELDKNLRK